MSAALATNHSINGGWSHRIQGPTKAPKGSTVQFTRGMGSNIEPGPTDTIDAMTLSCVQTHGDHLVNDTSDTLNVILAWMILRTFSDVRFDHHSNSYFIGL
jgi:hypothetical protein